MKLFLFAASFFGLTALMMDAFIAHGLEKFLGDHYTHIAEQSLSTAARYQLIFAIFLVCLTVLWRMIPNFWIVAAQSLIFLGILFFCGTIYLKHLLMITKIGMLAPLGGVLLMLSFVALLPAIFYL